MLMTDTWQPTVLQLMPFSANKAAGSQEEVYYEEERNTQTRGFPRLAVTRVQAVQDHSKQQKLARAVSEYACRRKDVRDPWNGQTRSRANSEYNSRTRIDDRDLAYSIKDLNDQILYSSKCDSFPAKRQECSSDKTWASSSSTDISEFVKCLSKPNGMRSIDGRYFLPQNGFWRAVTLTPGEIDLQKQRINFTSKPQRTKSIKRNKVNVNSIPRSTTPINDYDPDKLNMNQVIAFLQNKNEDVHTNSRKSWNVVSSCSDHGGQSPLAKEAPYDRDVIHVPLSASKNKTRQLASRQTHRASDNVPTMERFKSSNTKLQDNHKNINKGDKSVKQFRLHRFLAMASQTNDSEVSSTPRIQSSKIEENVETKLSFTPRQNIQGSKIIPYPNSSVKNFKSEPKLSVVRKPLFKPFQFAGGDNQSAKGVNGMAKDQVPLPNPVLEEVGVIRLPYVNHESDDEPGITAQKNSENTFIDSEKLQSILDSNFQISRKDIGFKLNNTKPSKKIQISLPNEMVTVDPPEANDNVRLSMRKERTLTRETTYMSDLCDSRTSVDLRGSMLSSVCSFRHDVDFEEEYE